MLELFQLNADLAQRATIVAMTMVAVGMAFATYRLIAGPKVVNRIIALDVVGTLSIGLVLMEAMRSGRALFIDIALCMAILLFLATVAFALYFKMGGRE